LYFNAERTILRCIENTAEYVDIVYIAYSEWPWSRYNTEARTQYRNNSDIKLLQQSKYIHKIKIIEGIWETDEDQRNAVLNAAKSDGIDYLIVQDADEFYFPDEFEKNINGIRQQPHFPYYYNPWINFWKNLEYVTLERHNIIGTEFSIYSKSANFAMNLRDYKDIHFTYSRQPNYPMESALKLDGVCYHLSYVYTDEDVRMKIKTWGHSQQVRQKWYYYKWLAWTPDSRYINPMMGPVWEKAVRFDGRLPKELENFPIPDHQHIQLSKKEKLMELFYDTNQLRIYVVHHLKGLVAKKLKLGQYKATR